MSLKTWFRGFKKVQYDYHLPSKEEATLAISLNRLAEASRKLEMLPVMEHRLSVRDISIEKIEDESIRRDIVERHKCVSFIRMSEEAFRQDGIKEITVDSHIFNIGLDNHLWDFNIVGALYCGCYTNEFDKELCNIVIDYINGVVEGMNLKEMVPTQFQKEFKCPYIDNFKDSQRALYDGYTKMFTETTHVNGMKHMYTLSPHGGNATVLNTTNIREFSLDDLIKKNSMIIDVIRTQEGVADGNGETDV